MRGDSRLVVVSSWSTASRSTTPRQRFAIEGVATRYTIGSGKWSDVAEIYGHRAGKRRPPLARNLLSFFRSG